MIPAIVILRCRSLSIELDRGLPPVRADLQKAKKVLVQLLENATKYSPPGEPVAIRPLRADLQAKQRSHRLSGDTKIVLVIGCPVIEARQIIVGFKRRE